MISDPFERRVAADPNRFQPERRVSQQVERLCGARKLNAHEGAHRCYEHRGHEGPHRCACAFEWAGEAAGASRL